MPHHDPAGDVRDARDAETRQRSAAKRGAALVVGAGAVGRAVARQWADEGRSVVLASRSGSGPERTGLTLRRLDATDGDAVAEAAEAADVIVNCASPAYHRWPEAWPPLSDALIAGAERSGAALVNLSNLYPYGPSERAYRPDDPPNPTSEKAAVRAAAWQAMRSAHDSGRIRAAEVRASDFVGPGTQSHLGDRTVPSLLAGKPVRVVGDPDAPHAWCYSEDVARTLRVVADRADAYGRVWHAPVAATVSQRDAIDAMAEVAGVDPVPVGRVAGWMLRVAGLFDRDVRELRHVLYQFERPFLLDDGETRDRLGLTPTPWRQVLAATVAAYQAA